MSELMPIKKIFNFEKGSLQSTKCTPGAFTFVTAGTDWKTHNEFTHETEALILAVAAAGSLGRCHYIKGKFIASDLCFILTPKNNELLPVDLEFYHQLFKVLKDDLVQKTATGTSKLSINRSNFGNYKIPYFDISHQRKFKNILNKIIDKKEKLLSCSKNQENLIDFLRKQVLHDVISGNLTTDQKTKKYTIESTSEMFEKIREVREKMIKDKKIKKDKQLPPISMNEVPFEIRSQYLWARVDNLFFIKKGETGIKKANPGIYPLVVTAEERLTHNVYEIDGEAILIPMVSSTGHGHASLKRIHFQDGKFALGSILSALIPITPEFISAKFYYYFLNNYRNQLIVSRMGGAANVALTQKALRSIIVPVLPIEVQQKAVRLLECANLIEGKIKQNKQDAEMLMQSFLVEAFKS